MTEEKITISLPPGIKDTSRHWHGSGRQKPNDYCEWHEAIDGICKPGWYETDERMMTRIAEQNGAVSMQTIPKLLKSAARELASVINSLNCHRSNPSDWHDMQTCYELATLSRTLTPQPIETAPTDGTRVLLYGAHDTDTGEMQTGWCEGYWDGMYWYHALSLPPEPTHWLPLPATPE